MNKLFALILSILSMPSLATEEQRLVTAGGSITEIVYALGAGSSLVGVDSSSQFPLEAENLPDIGYYRTLNVEGILSVLPTQMLALKGAGPESVLGQLTRMGVDVIELENPKSLTGLVTLINDIAAVVGRKEEGKILTQKIESELVSIQKAPKLTKSKGAFLMSAGERGLLTAGSGTTPQLIFEQLNIDNPFSKLEGFKPISIESLAQSSPDVILIASHTTRGQSVESLCNSSQLKLWASQNGCNLVKIDSLKFLGLTPRLPEAIIETRRYFDSL